MATEVLLSEDQLSKHQYWKSSSLRSGSAFCYLPRSQSAPKGSRSENAPRPRPRPAGKPNQSQAAGIRRSKKTSPNGRVCEVKQPKVAFVVKERSLVDKSNFQQKQEESPPPPKVTILQRPRSQEAAMIDLAKITGLPLSEVYAKNGLCPPKGPTQEVRPATPAPDLGSSKPSRKKPAAVLELRNGQGLEEVVARRKAGDGMGKRKSDNLETKKQVKTVDVAAKLPSKVPELAGRRNLVQLEQTVVETATTQQEQQQLRESAMKARQRSPSSSPSLRLSRCMSESFKSFGDILFQVPLFDEKWAGPAFTNSPPPSSLPLPKFMKKEATSVTTRTKNEALVAPLAPVGGGFKATEAELVLRRILNLDLC